MPPSYALPIAKALVVGNDKETWQSLSWLLHRWHPGLSVCGHARSVPEGIAMVRSLRPDILFVDVRIGDMTGFDLLKAIAPQSPHLIFLAHDETHAVRAIRSNALDYLIKPIVPEELNEAVSKALSEADMLMPQAMNHTFSGISLGEQQVALPMRDGYILLYTDDILHCTSDNNYTEVHTRHNRKPHLITRPLSGFRSMLKEPGFVRIHQSHLVNRKHIIRYMKGEGGEVMMSDGQVLPVSRRLKSGLMQVLKTL